MAFDPGFLAFAFSAGVGTFFSPCSVALIPAYVGYYLGLDAGEDRAPLPRAALAGLRLGVAASIGILAVFVGAGALVWLLRTRFGLDSGSLSGGLTVLALLVGAVLAVLGVLMAWGRGPTITFPVRAPQGRTTRGMAFFGVVFAIASLGCSLPLFFFVLVSALAQGAGAGFAGFVAYGAGFAGLMLVASVGLAVARDAVAARIRWLLPKMKVASGVILVLAGAYLWYYYLVLVP